MRRAALLSALIVLAAGAAPAAAPAKRTCHMRACQGKVVRAKRAGMPPGWTARGPIGAAPGGGGITQPPSGGTPTRPGDPPPSPPPLPPVPDDPHFLQVVARDAGTPWALQLSRPAVLSGAVKVEFNNRFAGDPHDLHLRRGTTEFSFDTIAKGATRTETLGLAAGTWKLWCALPDHEANGMVAYVTVADG